MLKGASILFEWNMKHEDTITRLLPYMQISDMKFLHKMMWNHWLLTQGTNYMDIAVYYIWLDNNLNFHMA
jgi:hypothetical protein